jgi:integrase
MIAIEAAAARGSYVVADRVLGLTRAIYNWAGSTGRTEVNPTLGLKKRNTSRPRERVLLDDEIRALWLRLDTPSKLSPEIRDAFKLQLLLGLRISEALEAPKVEIDLGRQIWTIPALRTKPQRELRLPLSPPAVTILRNAIERAGNSPWLFPSPVDQFPVRPQSAMRAMHRICVGLELVDVGTHDLRRTLATGLGNLGISDEVIERVLNHAPRTVAGKHYNHAKHFDGMKQALEAWADHIGALVGRPFELRPDALVA